MKRVNRFHVNSGARVPQVGSFEWSISATGRTVLVRVFWIQQLIFAAGCVLIAAGCGTAVQRNGTEQLLLSDSVDRAIDQLDLSPLSGRTVFLDTTYMQTFKGANVYINSDYITSALRQKLTTTGCLIETTKTEADYVLEARVGALGTDTMEVTYGIPSSGVGAAATALSGVPTPAPATIPEMSVGKRKGAIGVSKIVVFAYHRDSGIPVWQSGAAVARSDAKDSWFLGIGPLSRGNVYDGTTLAGNKINPPFEKKSARRQVKPLTIADTHSYIHPAVLERQLTEAKESDSAAKTVERASYESEDFETFIQGSSQTPPPVPPSQVDPPSQFGPLPP